MLLGNSPPLKYLLVAPLLGSVTAVLQQLDGMKYVGKLEEMLCFVGDVAFFHKPSQSLCKSFRI